MANILPVSDLRNYNEVLKNCRKVSLYILLRMAEEAVKDGEGWLSLDGLKALVGE